jgi:hypothetical protein
MKVAALEILTAMGRVLVAAVPLLCCDGAACTRQSIIERTEEQASPHEPCGRAVTLYDIRDRARELLVDRGYGERQPPEYHPPEQVSVARGLSFLFPRTWPPTDCTVALYLGETDEQRLSFRELGDPDAPDPWLVHPPPVAVVEVNVATGDATVIELAPPDDAGVLEPGPHRLDEYEIDLLDMVSGARAPSEDQAFLDAYRGFLLRRPYDTVALWGRYPDFINALLPKGIDERFDHVGKRRWGEDWILARDSVGASVQEP